MGMSIFPTRDEIRDRRGQKKGTLIRRARVNRQSETRATTFPTASGDLYCAASSSSSRTVAIRVNMATGFWHSASLTSRNIQGFSRY